MNTITWKTVDIKSNYWETINKTKEIYLAYDCELEPLLITDNIKTIIKYCKENHCQYSIYPVGCYSHIS